MFCRFCGSQVQEYANFCGRCGGKVKTQAQPAVYPAAPAGPVRPMQPEPQACVVQTPGIRAWQQPVSNPNMFYPVYPAPPKEMTPEQQQRVEEVLMPRQLRSSGAWVKIMAVLMVAIFLFTTIWTTVNFIQNMDADDYRTYEQEGNDYEDPFSFGEQGQEL